MLQWYHRQPIQRENTNSLTKSSIHVPQTTRGAGRNFLVWRAQKPSQTMPQSADLLCVIYVTGICSNNLHEKCWRLQIPRSKNSTGWSIPSTKPRNSWERWSAQQAHPKHPIEENRGQISLQEPTVNSAPVDKGKRQANFPELYKEDASGVGKTTANVLPTTLAAHVAKGVTSGQLAAEQAQTMLHQGQRRKTVSWQPGSQQCQSTTLSAQVTNISCNTAQHRQCTACTATQPTNQNQLCCYNSPRQNSHNTVSLPDTECSQMLVSADYIQQLKLNVNKNNNIQLFSANGGKMSARVNTNSSMDNSKCKYTSTSNSKFGTHNAIILAWFN